MNAATCAALAAVYPVVLLTLVIDRARLLKKLRQAAWYRRVAEYATSASLVGLILSVVGIQLNGLDSGWAVAAWLVFATVAFGLLLHVAGLLASLDVSDEAENAPPTSSPGSD